MPKSCVNRLPLKTMLRCDGLAEAVWQPPLLLGARPYNHVKHYDEETQACKTLDHGDYFTDRPLNHELLCSRSLVF